MTCQASDNGDYVGKTIEIKVLQLDDATFTYQFPGENGKQVASGLSTRHIVKGDTITVRLYSISRYT